MIPGFWMWGGQENCQLRLAPEAGDPPGVNGRRGVGEPSESADAVEGVGLGEISGPNLAAEMGVAVTPWFSPKSVQSGAARRGRFALGPNGGKFPHRWAKKRA